MSLTISNNIERVTIRNMKFKLIFIEVVLYVELITSLNPEIHQPFCRDRDGLMLPFVEFKISTCSMCYFYLVKSNPKFVKRTGCRHDYQRTVCLGENIGSGNVCFCPSLDDTMSMADIYNSISDKSLANKWIMCCEDANECCQHQLSTAYTEENQSEHMGLCPKVWDGWMCWNDTAIGTVAVQSCPRFLDLGVVRSNIKSTGKVTKSCSVDGSWWKDPVTNNEKTNYTNCFPDDLTGRLEFFRKVTSVSIALNIVGMLLLSPAIVIFLYYRNLRRQKRIKIHIMFFSALLLNGFTVLCWDVIIKYPKINHAMNNGDYRDKKMLCNIMILLEHYFRSTTYFWMSSEGFYLHRLLTNAFSPPKRLIGYYLIGWGIPLVIVAVYLGLRLHNDNSTCWVEPTSGSLSGLEWILFAPTILCIAVNLCFLLNILRILLRQLVHPQEHKSFRKAVKATFVLIPLFGIHQFFTVYRPPHGDHAYYFCEMAGAIIYNSQGMSVSLIFCFCNTEVISNLKMSWQKWKTSSAIERRSTSATVSRQTSVMSLNGIVAENPSDISLNGTTQSISIRKTYQANVKNLTETHL